ncbi:MAG: ABC transporter ATP-binding protein [Lachnospiraceae bacterium]|nr:ABC transporter ATP-binding protein [Lachnospiraceae bacterium]
MKMVLQYLKDYKKESILAPLFKMLEASFELFVPLVVAAIIDVGIAGLDRSYILKMGAVLVALALVGLICSVTAQYFSAKAAAGFATKLRHALFAHLQGLSFSQVDSIGTSTMITRMTSDINQVQSGVNMTLRLFLRSPIVVFGAMIMAFTVDVKAALIFVVAIPLLSLVVFGIMLVTIPLYKKVQQALDKVLGKTRENLTGVRVIRAFNQEEQETREFKERNEALTTIQKFVGKISAAMNPVTYVIVNGALIALIWTGALRVENGYISQGEVVALVNYMSQILIELVKLANLIILITKAVACANRIEAAFAIEPDMDIEAKGGKKVQEKEDIVVFDHVGLAYQGASEEAVSDISFTVKRGQTIGIIGGTGSGKSTIVNMIPRFYDATSGKVLIDGIDVKEYTIKELRQKIGMVLQKAVLFKGSIRENLKWGKEDATEEELMRALEISQAKEFVDTKEGGLDYRIEQGGKNLSGGQKQRLTIARAVVRDPEILILDDSASALDFATDAKLRQAIRGMKDKLTVFIVSQRASSIQYADQIIVMDDGKIVGIGKHNELLASCEVYKEIYDSQFRKEGEK